jgi:hypothetical protein
VVRVFSKHGYLLERWMQPQSSEIFGKSAPKQEASAYIVCSFGKIHELQGKRKIHGSRSRVVETRGKT